MNEKHFEGCKKAIMLETVKTKKGNVIGERGEEVLVWNITEDEALIYSIRSAASGRVLRTSLTLPTEKELNLRNSTELQGITSNFL